MRVFISDYFYTKTFDMPRSVQQDVQSFIGKFRTNSQSAAIHLEPIHNFKDQSLRSARVNQGYRAIVGVMGGDNFILLYVDKHDLAYQWAENKKFAWNEFTQCCQIITTTVEQPAAAAEPAPAPDESALGGYTDEQLLRIGVPEDLISLARSIRDMDDLERVEPHLPQDAYEHIFDLMDDTPIEIILADIEAGKAGEGEDSLLSGNNRRSFIEITDDDTLAQMFAEGTEKWQLFLHPSQTMLVEGNYKSSVKVSGSAGTGKTVAAIHRLKRLAAQPGAKVLFTTYTKTLRENLEGLIAKMGISKNYTLSSIDSAMLSLAKEYGIIGKDCWVHDYETGDKSAKDLWREVLTSEVTTFDENFLHTEYADVILYNDNRELKDYLTQSRIGRARKLSRKDKVDIWNLKEKYEALKRSRKIFDRLELFNMVARHMRENDLHPFTNVICDEFQDFSNPELRFLRALVKEGPNDLFLVGDPFQRIYGGRKVNFGALHINVKGKRSIRLKVNYRTTEEIKRMAVSVLKDQSYDDLDGGIEDSKGYVSLVHGKRPEYELFGNPKAEAEHVVAQIKELLQDHVMAKDICVAAPTRALYGDVKSKLHNDHMGYVDIKNGRFQGSDDDIRFCTFHSLKGLEFRVLFLVGVSEQSMPSQVNRSIRFQNLDAVAQREELLGIRSLLYVAISRGREVVCISGCREKTRLLR